MIWFVSGLTLLTGVLFLVDAFTKADVRILASAIRWLAVIVVTGLAILLATRGFFLVSALIAGGAYLLLLWVMPWLGRAAPEPTEDYDGFADETAFEEGQAANEDAQEAAQQTWRPTTQAEALDVLGLKDDASSAEVQHAYHILMKRFHPDHGGTDEMAQQLNAARDVLLGTMGRERRQA